MMGQDEKTPPPMRQMDHRYDAYVKVTGKAKFAYEFEGPFDRADMLYAYVVQSTIPNGTIVSIDSTATNRASGSVAVLTPFNAPKFPLPSAQPPARVVT